MILFLREATSTVFHLAHKLSPSHFPVTGSLLKKRKRLRFKHQYPKGKKLFSNLLNHLVNVHGVDQPNARVVVRRLSIQGRN